MKAEVTKAEVKHRWSDLYSQVMLYARMCIWTGIW